MPDLRSLRNLLGAIFALTMLIFAAQGGATPADALTNCNVTDATFNDSEKAFLDIINQYRTSNGLQPLTVSVNLNRSASWMAQDLATKNYFAHRDSLGRESQTRIAECGSTLSSGENLAAGTRIDSAQSAFGLWRSSGGHNRNMLFADYTQIGIARAHNPGSRYTWYWVTTFAVPDDGTRMSNNISLLSPKPSTKLASRTATFEWSSSPVVQEFKLDIGTTPGGTQVYSASQGLAKKVTVGNLPWQTRNVYVRLWARVGSVWQFTDYVYIGADWYQ
jgi:uncharacterized protein YkwD